PVQHPLNPVRGHTMQVQLRQALHVDRDLLRVALRLEEASRHTQPDSVKPHLVELAARNLKARLILALLHRLGLGVQETLLLHPDTEVRLTGPPQTTASNPNLRQREQSLSRGNLKEVVDGLRRGAPSSSGHQGVAGQVPLIRGRLDRGTKRVRVTPNQVVGNLTVQEAEGGRVLSGAR